MTYRPAPSRLTVSEIERMDRKFAPPERQLPLELPAPTATSNLTPQQCYALLFVRTGNAGEGLFAKVLQTMEAMGIDQETADLGSSFAVLIGQGYLTRKTPHTTPEVTPPGLYKAAAIARELAKQYQVHHIIKREALARSNMGPFAFCTCGHFYCARGRHRGNGLDAAAARHMAAVSAGTWKVPPSVAEILDAMESRNG